MIRYIKVQYTSDWSLKLKSWEDKSIKHWSTSRAKHVKNSSYSGHRLQYISTCWKYVASRKFEGDLSTQWFANVYTHSRMYTHPCDCQTQDEKLTTKSGSVSQSSSSAVESNFVSTPALHIFIAVRFSGKLREQNDFDRNTTTKPTSWRKWTKQKATKYSLASCSQWSRDVNKETAGLAQSGFAKFTSCPALCSVARLSCICAWDISPFGWCSAVLLFYTKWHRE